MLGRESSDSPLRIFLRGENLEIAKRLNAFVASNKILFSLQGPPGVGKTMESIIWMLQSVVQTPGDLWAWVRLTMSGAVLSQVYLLKRSVTHPREVRYKVFRTRKLIEELVNWGVKVVIFDNCNDRNRGLVDECVQEELKTIAVSSMQMKFDSSLKAQEAEYHEACKDDAFYDLVKAALQTGDFTAAELPPGWRERALDVRPLNRPAAVRGRYRREHREPFEPRRPRPDYLRLPWRPQRHRGESPAVPD